MNHGLVRISNGLARIYNVKFVLIRLFYIKGLDFTLDQNELLEYTKEENKILVLSAKWRLTCDRKTNNH